MLHWVLKVASLPYIIFKQQKKYSLTQYLQTAQCPQFIKKMLILITFIDSFSLLYILKHAKSIIQSNLIAQPIYLLYKNYNIYMHYFNKFKNILQQAQQADINNPIPKKSHLQYAIQTFRKSSQSYQLIMLDILEDSQIKQNKIESFKDNQNQNTNEKKKSQQLFEDLVFQQAEHEEIQNIYMKDFIFVNKLSQARELTVDEWSEMIEKGNISIYPKKNIYFSIFKGIKFQVRKKAWQLFANTSQMKKLTTRSYKDLIRPQGIRADIVAQIQKDVPRSKSITNYLPELRNILIAYCALTHKDYTQGMNLIAGALLTLLALQNDEQLSSFEIVQKQFEQRVFWIFIGVMVWKNWQDIFDKQLLGLTKRLQILQCLMAEHVPAVYQKLIDYQWDLTIFSQYYITIMLYNTPKEFSKIILDLFFLDGQNALHSLIIRMMKMQEDKILSFSDECQLMNYFKKQIIMDCYLSVKKNQVNAKKLQDFQMNFMKSTKG